MAEDRAARAISLELLSGVAHDFKTPLAAVKGAVSALRRDGDALDEATRERLLGVIADAADQLGRLVDDLLVAGRLEDGRLPVEIAPCDAGAVAESVVAAARAAAPSGVSVRLVAPAGLPPAAADPDRLRQVLANLVDNAVRHTPGGGTVEVLIGATPGRLRLSVTDEGPGVAPADRAVIFDRYNRGAGGGSGLGLHLARELARAMGGDVTVDSGTGAGAAFTVELPLA